MTANTPQAPHAQAISAVRAALAARVKLRNLQLADDAASFRALGDAFDVQLSARLDGLYVESCAAHPDLEGVKVARECEVSVLHYTARYAADAGLRATNDCRDYLRRALAKL